MNPSHPSPPLHTNETKTSAEPRTLDEDFDDADCVVDGWLDCVTMEEICGFAGTCRLSMRGAGACVLEPLALFVLLPFL
jgi:hypothetical protein